MNMNDVYGKGSTAVQVSSVTLRNNRLRTTPNYPALRETADGRLVPLNTPSNVRAVLAAMGVTVRRNLMTLNTEITGAGLDRLSFDACRGAIRGACEATGYRNPPLVKYLESVAADNEYHPVYDVLTSVKWDGIDRVQQVADSLVSDMNSDLKRAYLLRWSVGAVQAVLREEPMAQQGVLTLQGGRNVGKTTFLRELMDIGVPEAFKGGVKIYPSDRASVLRIIGHWCVEAGEVDINIRCRKAAYLQSFITQDYDELRRPYMRGVERIPRRTAICATVNPKEFLINRINTRRWWVIPVKSIKQLSTQGIDMVQYWAQMAVLYHSGYDHSLTDEELQMTIQRNNAHTV